jgi:NitT/TauT family transport system permease protein
VKSVLPPISVEKGTLLPTRWDLLAVLLVLGLVAFLAETSRTLMQPLAELQAAPISLDAGHLPGYAARTALRMLAAMVLSLMFTFTYATLAAKSRRAELVLIPVLDILQSVPILGFISITIVFFMSLAPGKILGAEFAAIFAIFTSQAWNMAFSFYQSLRTVPEDLIEASRCFRFPSWMRFWRVEVPFAMPALIWNMMMSMSGGWFFVVASEAISVGDTTVTLPGIGSYIALAIAQRDMAAIGLAIATMLIVILIYDQLLFRPLVAWADRFRFEQEAGILQPLSWVRTVLIRSRLVARAMAPLAAAWRWSYRLQPRLMTAKRGTPSNVSARGTDGLWLAIVLILSGFSLWKVWQFVFEGLSMSDVATATGLSAITMVRVVGLIAIASVIWVPIGVWVGMRPRIARWCNLWPSSWRLFRPISCSRSQCYGSWRSVSTRTSGSAL